MTQIKLSIAFVLAAAAIAPIVAQPIRESHEFSGDVVPHRHPHHPPHLRHYHHLHHRHGVVIPEQSPLESTSDTTPPPSPREYADESEARSLPFGHIDDLSLNMEKSLDAQLEHNNQVLESENRHLEHKNRHLRHKERHLEHKNHRLEREDTKLEHRKHSLERKDKSLLGKKHHLEREDHRLSHKHKTLEEEDKALEGKHRSLFHKNKVLERKDKKLAHEGHVLAHHDRKLKLKGKALAHHDKVLAKEGEVLAHHNKVLAQEGEALGHRLHSEPEIVAREYDEVFERDSAEAESAGHALPHTLPHFKGPFHFGHGPVVIHPHNRPFTHKLPFGVVNPGGPIKPIKPIKHTRLHFGPGPIRLPHGPAKPMIVDREYIDIEDVVERDFEDDEFEARDFDEELYLD